ncbi:hypothetical protein HF521_012307 [Silurus meridionalis]|uniref:Gap junction protein n=1 Tax=Silurus meridionalis TaxID=175797 RepID=A0A8T0AGB1_SILME|nr:hypothetical protein HF521_012307 [Silurus meridionalis]
MDDVDSVAEIQQGGSGHEDDLHDPKADVGDGKLPVVANVLTTRCHGVTNQIRSLVSPHVLNSCTQNEDPEDEEDAHPDLANDSGVSLHFIQQSREKSPVSHSVQIVFILGFGIGFCILKNLESNLSHGRLGFPLQVARQSAIALHEHRRFWVLQIIFVSLPTIVYLGYALHVIHAEDKLRQKYAEKRGNKLPKYTDDNGKLQYKGSLLRIYVSCILMTILFEAGFIVGQYYLYGFMMEPKLFCKELPCPHVIECFMSRPTEKTIFILFMLVVACVSLLLNVAEIVYLICRASKGKKHQQEYLTEETHC